MMKRVLARAAIALVIVGSLAACDNGLTDSNRGQIEGVSIRSNRTEVASFRIAGETVTGELRVAAGQTVTFEVRAIGAGGGVFPLSASGFTIGNPNVIKALFASASIQGADRLVIEGLKAGSTTVRFKVLGSLGAEVFPVSNIPLEVSDQGQTGH